MHNPDLIKKGYQQLSYWVKHHLYLIFSVISLSLLVLPYLTTGNSIELGDFSFLAQIHEAIRVTLVDYHQFPWWNPWLSGGIPLYADPQAGTFSLQTLLTIPFGASVGLKLTIASFTVLGAASMYLLLRYRFGIQKNIAILTGVIWAMNGFFCSHLPAHFTFIWYLIAPLYVHLTLRLHTVRGGALLGIALALMALGAFHYAFIHIIFVCGLLLVYRTITTESKKQLLLSFAATTITFLTLAGHRLAMVFTNMQAFNHVPTSDPAFPLSAVPFALFFPYSHNFPEITLSIFDKAPFGWYEATASMGAVIFISLTLMILYIIKRIRDRTLEKKIQRTTITFIVISLFFCLLGLGDFSSLSPYAILQHISPFSTMRVSTRWFIWVVMAALVWLAITINSIKNATIKGAFVILLYISVIELGIYNWGYQSNIFTYDPAISEQPLFLQEFKQSETGLYSIDNLHTISRKYSELEIMSYNTGLLRANEPLLDLRGTRHLRLCGIEKNCNLILSNNAIVSNWTPNGFTLTRSGGGDIIINMNQTHYLYINDKQTLHTPTIIPEPIRIKIPDRTIHVEFKP